MPKVSVIVPVYNTELYVERAIVSLMEQTLYDIQIIIIDDGSNDDSLNIIKQVIERYPCREDQVTLISRENRGIAATRNQGLELAIADYVIHLDSDDWAVPNWLEIMYEKAINENADVVICDYNVVYAKKITYIKQAINGDGFIGVKEILLGKLHGSTWNKLIRRSLIISNNLFFPKDINYIEDVAFIIQVFLSAPKIEYVESALVNYNRINVSSITSSIDDDKVKNILDATNFINDILCKNVDSSNLISYLNCFKLNQKKWIIYSNRKKIPSYMWLIYPETNTMILSSAFPFHIKMILYIGSHVWGGLGGMLIHLVENLRGFLKFCINITKPSK